MVRPDPKCVANFNISMTPEQKEFIDAECERLRYSRSGYIRERLFGKNIDTEILKLLIPVFIENELKVDLSPKQVERIKELL